MRNAIVIAVVCAVSGIAHAQRATVVIVDDSMSSEKLTIAERAIESMQATLEKSDELSVVHTKRLTDGIEQAKKKLKAAKTSKRVVLLTEAKLGISALGEKLLRDGIAMETPPVDGELNKAMSARIETKKREPVAVVFVIDRGWSMRGKIDAAKKLVRDVIDGLTNDDYVGVITFESESSTSVSLKRATARGEIGTAVERIQLGIGSLLYAGLKDAKDMLAKSTLKRRVVVIADPDGVLADGVVDLVDDMAVLKIEISTVATEPKFELLKYLATRGHGDSHDLSKQTAAQIGRWLRD